MNDSDGDPGVEYSLIDLRINWVPLIEYLINKYATPSTGSIPTLWILLPFLHPISDDIPAGFNCIP